MKILMAVLMPLLALFNAKKVECYTQYGLCIDKYSHIVSQWQGYPLYSKLPKLEIAKSLEFPEVKSVNVYRRLPSTLIINLQLRQTIGLMGGTVLGDKIAIDEEGLGFMNASGEDLPLLITDSMIKSGSKVSSNEHAALEVLGWLQNNLKKKVIGRINGPNDLLVDVSGGLEIQIDLKKNKDSWSYPLQVLLNRSKMTGKVIKKIDLRFNNPVITYL